MQTSNFMKIHPVKVVPCGLMKGQAEDMMELITVAFHNFASGPKTNVLLP